MELQTELSSVVPVPGKQVPRIDVDGISVAYSTGQRPDGSWFALGTVSVSGDKRNGPATVVVGVGSDEPGAIINLAETVRNKTRVRELV